MRHTINGGTLTIFLDGRIDAGNADAVGAELKGLIAGNKGLSIVFDASGLEYISSAGLRLLLKARKEDENAKIVNVGSEVYDILEVTGFTDLIEVRKKLRELTVQESQLIGAGANGRVYRLDDERIVKVYNTFSNPPEKIERERLSARKAFVKGIPSAIPFDIVQVGQDLGMIYELIDAHTLGSAVRREPERLEEYALKMSALLRQLHSSEFEEGELPDARESLTGWLTLADNSGYYRSEDIARVRDLIERIPARNTFIHGDFHPGNIMLSDGELMLIDMSDTSAGHPVIDLSGMYQIMCLLSRRGDEAAMKYTGLTTAEARQMWDIFARDYFGTSDPGKLRKIESSLRCYAIIRSLAGVTFSAIIPKEERSSLAKKAMSALLACIDNAVPVP